MDLKPGETRCKKCKGTGFWHYRKSNKSNGIICDKCNGSGKFDWVENIVGKKQDLYVLWFPLDYYNYKIEE